MAVTKTKNHVPPPEEWLILRDRDGDKHARLCADGYIAPKKKKPNVLEIHHLLCVDACSDGSFATLGPDEKIVIKICLARTVWDINLAPNNIGLPTKWAFVKDRENGTGWDKLPCHQTDHDLYLDAVLDWMMENVWLEITGSAKKKKCEYLEGKGVKDLFEAGSALWKTMLQTRGKSHGGTKACLDYCRSGRADDADKEKSWYVPFSMAPTEAAARERVRPTAHRKLVREGLLDMID